MAGVSKERCNSRNARSTKPLRASVAHLNNEWRKRYFAYIEQESGTADRLGVGLNALWRLMQDPLHVAKQELVAAARSNAELRAVMQQEAGFDEATTLETAKQAYPDLAGENDSAFQRALDFTVVFLEGLSRHQFSGDAKLRCEAQLDMLKAYLDGYWRSQGIALSPPGPALVPSRVDAQPATPARGRSITADDCAATPSLRRSKNSQLLSPDRAVHAGARHSSIRRRCSSICLVARPSLR